MNRISLIIICLLAALTAGAADNAEKTLDRCLKTLTTSPSVTIAYNLSSGTGNTSGAMTVAGSRFLIDSPQMAVWFDGKTQWTYAKEQKEVSVTVPTADELSQINPLMVLDNFRKNFSATMLKSTAGTQSVKLTPKRPDGGIDAAVVNINERTGSPESIVLTLSNRTTVSIRIKSISKGIKLNDASFRFNPKNYPGVEVIDLR